MPLKRRHLSVLTLLTVTFFALTSVAVSAPSLQTGDSPVASPEPPTLADPLPALLQDHFNHLQHRRSKRAFGDFFAKLWTVGALGKAQYDDTRTTLAKIYDILRDNFSDTMVKKTPAVVSQSGAVGNGTSSSGGVTEMPATTTTEKYRISRKELGRILNRNFRGLKRLAEIERRDAQNATKYNIKEYKVQLANSLQSFVYNLPSN